MDKLFKRKKQETDANDDEEEDLEEGVDLPLLPKRTKVQAQRKFAQGSSPMVTPVKEGPAEVDTTPIVPMAPVFTQPPVNQPKTEDFLTYLCFRGTSLVSRRLSDMFSTPSPVVHSTSDQKNSTAKKIRKKRLTEEDLMGKGKLSRQKMSAAPLKKLKQQDQTRMRGVLPPHSTETKAPSSRKQQQFKTKDISVVKKPGVGGGPGRKPKSAGVLRKAQMTQRERLKSRHATSSVASSRSGLRSSGILSSGIEEGLPPRKRHRHLTLTSAGVRKGQGAVGSKRAVLQRNKHIGVVKCAPNQKKQRATRHKMSDEVSLPASKTSVVASVRPSRKSKEAAAVYMDLLGEEVKNPEAFDEDDNSSVESFPELPKARTMERRERQIREMVAAQKEKAESKTPISKPKTIVPRIASKKLTVQSLLKKRLTRSSLKQPKLRKQPTGKDVTLDKRKTRAKLRDGSKTDLEESKTKDIEESSEGMTNTRPSRNVRNVQNKSSERNESPKLRRTRSDNSPVVTVDELSPGKLSKVTMRKDETHTETQSNEDSANKSKESRVTDNDRPGDGKKTKANTKDERKVNAQDEEQSKTNDKVKTRATRSVRKANEEVNDGEKRESETKTKKESKAGSRVCDDEKKPESEERTKEEINNPEGVNTTPKNLDAKSKNDTEDKGGTNRKKKIKPSMQQKIDFDEIVRDETFVSKNRAAKSSNDERKGKPESQGKAKKKKDIEENNVTVFVTKVDVEKVVDSGSPLKPRDISSKIYVADSKEKAQAVKAITFEEKEQAAPCSTAQEVLSCSTISPSTPSNCPPQTTNNQTKETNKISPDSSVVPSKTLLKMKSSEEINDNSNVGDSKQWKEEELNKVQAPSLSFQNAYGKKTDQDPKVSPKLMKSTAELIPEVKANTAQSKTSSADKIPETQEDTDKMSTDPRNNTSNKVKRVQLTPSKIVTQLNSSTSSNLNKVTVPEDKMWNSKDNSPHTSSSILSVNSNSTLKPRSRATLFVKGSDNSNLSPMIQIADTFRLNFGKDAEKKDSKQMSKKETNISESTIAELDKELSNFVKDIVKSDWDGKNFDIPLNRPIRDTGSKARKQISTIDFINSTPVKCSSNEEINIRNDKVIISPLRKLTENEIRILLAQESPMKINEKSPEVFNHSTVENLSRTKGSSEAEDSVSKLCIEKITNEIISLIDPKMNLAETQDIIKKYNLNKQLQIRLTEERQITAAGHRADPVVSKPSYSSVTTASQKTEPVSSKPGFSSLTSASQKTEPVSSKPGFSSLTSASQKTEPVSSKPSFSSLTTASQKTEPVSSKPSFSSLTTASQKTEPVSSKPGFSSLTSASQKTEPVSSKPSFSSLTTASQKTEPVSSKPGFSSLTTASQKTEPVSSKPSFSSLTTASQKTEPVSSKPGFSSLTSTSQKTEPVSIKPGFSSLTSASQKTEPVSSKPGFSSLLTPASQKTEPVSSKPGFSSLTSASQKTEPVSTKPGFSSLTPASQKTEPVSSKPGISSLTPASQKTEPLGNKPTLSPLSFPKTMASLSKQNPFSNRTLDNPLNSITVSEISLLNQKMEKQPFFSNQTSPLNTLLSVNQRPLTSNKASSPNSPKDKQSPERPLWSQRSEKHSLLAHKKPGTLDKQYRLSSTMPGSVVNDLSQSDKPAVLTTQNVDRLVTSPRLDKLSLLPSPRPGTLDKQYRLTPKDSSPLQRLANPLTLSSHMMSTPEQTTSLNLSQKATPRIYPPDVRCQSISRSLETKPSAASIVKNVDAKSSSTNATSKSIDAKTSSTNAPSKIIDAKTSSTNAPSKSVDAKSSSTNKSIDAKSSLTCTTSKSIVTKPSSTNTTSKSIDTKSSSTCKSIDAKSSSTNATIKSVVAKSSSTNATCKSVDAKPSSTNATSKSVDTKSSSTNATSESVDVKDSSTLTNSISKSIDQKSSGISNSKSINPKSRNISICKNTETKSSNNSINKSLDTRSSNTTGSTCHKTSPNSLNQPNQTFSEVPITLSKTYQTIILDTRLNTNSPSKDSSSEPLKLDSKCVNNVQKTDCDKANLSRNRAKSVEEDNNMIADYIKDKKSDSKQSDHIPSSKNPPERQIIKAFEDKYEPKSSPTKNIRKYSNLGKKSPGKQSAKQDRNITKSLRTKKDTNYLEDYSSTDTSDDDMTSKTSTKSAPRKRKTAASTKEKALSEFSSDSDVDDMIEKIRTDERKKPRVKNEDAKKSANPESQKSISKESSTSDKSDLKKSKKDRPSTEKKDTIKTKKEDEITGNRRLRNKQSVLYNLESLETDSDTPDEEIILVKRKSEEQGKKRKGKKSSTSENLESDEKESKNKKLKTEPEEVKPKRGRKKKQKEVEDNEPDKDSPKNDNRVEDETKETSESDSDVRKKKTWKKRSRKQNKQVDESSESETDDAKEKSIKKKTRKRNEDNIKKEDEEILLQTEECGTRKNLRRKPCHLYAENLSSNSEDDLELLIQNRSDEIETQNLMNHPRKSKKLLDQILAKSKQEAKEKSEDTRPSKRSCVNSDSSSEEEDDGKSKQSKGKKKIDKSKLTKTPKKSSSKQTKHSEESTSDSEKSSKKQVKTPKKDLKMSKKSPEKSESPQEDGSENRSKRASRTQSMMINTSSDSEDDPLLAIAKTISRNEVRMSRRSIDLLHAKEKEILKKNETSDEEDSEEESDEEKVKKEAKIITKLSDSSSSKKKTKDTENKEELLKPIAASGKSSQCSSLDVSNKISSLIEKDKQKRGLDTSNDKEKTSSTLQQEAVQRLEKQPFTPEKKPMSREQLHSSWKSAFQNLKLPKTSPSVSKTPMDRNAWIRKHAMLTKPKTENKATFEPFKINYSRSSSPMSVSSHNSDHMATPVEGKHHNLPMPVEQTLKRMANISPKVNKIFHFEQKATPPPPVVEKLTPGKIEDIPKAGNFNESIIKWLNDSIPNDDSSCDDTNSTSKKLTSRYCDDTDTSVASSVIDKGIVSAPVQLKDIFSSPVSFTSEKISSVKVDDYKKLKQKSIFTSPSLDRKCRYEETPEKRKQLESETDSLVSDLSSCDETKHEKKAIFQQRRSLAERLKERQTQSSRAKVAFSPQNESSVYAFEPEPTETSPSTPFRRSNSKNTTPSPSMSKPGSPCNSSIAVQVNFESDTVLECSTTQTELSGSQADAGHLFYIPLQKNGQDTSSAIQGVAVKLGTEGPDQRVIMSAKLVTKPPASSDFAKPSSVSCLVPQRRVRPFNTPIVGTVQPMSRPTTGTQVSPRSQHTQTPPPPPKPSASSTTSSSSASTGTTKSEKKGKSKSSSSTSASVPNKKRHSSSPEPSTSSPSRSTPCATAVKHKNFPSKGSRALMVEAPTYYPTEKEFQDPFEYIEKIRPSAEQFGICRIVPPSSFKPECKLNDDMRFTAYNQYVHKMLHRWGPNVKEMVAIRKYLATQSVSMQQLPVIGGIEVDLPRLYSTVQQCGGLSEVIEKKRWPRVADLMRIPRLAQDRLSKLDDIYCKYLLPYDTLGHDERSKLFDAVEAEWGTHFNSSLEDEDEEEEDENNDDDLDECTVKGRSIPLSAFYRIARNTMAMYFKSDNPNDPGSNPSPTEVETEFWNHVTNRMLHICVHSASIDTGSNGCGFPTAKNSTFAKHPWNLKVLTNNSASILRSLNNVVGVTVPTLHVGMLFSACCWYRDPHGLPWIEYLHSGASKIWYGIPDEHSTAFRSTMMSLFPHYCHNDRTIWLSSDVAMVPPSLLTEKGVSLSRVVQDPGQFVLVFPSAFTSSIATGYLVAESVYFARPSWLDNCERVFKDMQDSSEPSEFSLELLFFAIAADSRSSADVLTRVLPMIESIRNLEIAYRSQLSDLGLKKQERISTSSKKGPGRKKAAVTEEEEEHECDVCRAHLPISMVQNSEEEEPVDYCLKHGIETLTQNMDLVKHCKLLFYYDEEELGEVISKLKDRIKAKSLKKLSDKTGA